MMNLYSHGPVCSFAVYPPPYTSHSPRIGGFSCGAIADKELTKERREYSLIKEP